MSIREIVTVEQCDTEIDEAREQLAKAVEYHDTPSERRLEQRLRDLAARRADMLQAELF